jgi:hypothetical protein
VCGENALRAGPSVLMSSRFNSRITGRTGCNLVWRLCYTARPQNGAFYFLARFGNKMTDEKSREVDIAALRSGGQSWRYLTRRSFYLNTSKCTLQYGM